MGNQLNGLLSSPLIDINIAMQSPTLCLKERKTVQWSHWSSVYVYTRAKAHSYLGKKRRRREGEEMPLLCRLIDSGGTINMGGEQRRRERDGHRSERQTKRKQEIPQVAKRICYRMRVAILQVVVVVVVVYSLFVHTYMHTFQSRHILSDAGRRVEQASKRASERATRGNKREKCVTKRESVQSPPRPSVSCHSCRFTISPAVPCHPFNEGRTQASHKPHSQRRGC